MNVIALARHLAATLALVLTLSVHAQTYEFTTLAGNVGTSGSVDGTGANARFRAPYGVAVDGAGNVYVSDSENATIRKVTPAGVVSTFAGVAGSFGNVDGPATVARFRGPRGLAVDASGHVYVADTSNGNVKKITPAGVVSTFASGFASPGSVAIDAAGNVFVGDSNNSVIRKVTPAGVVSIFAGTVGVTGAIDGPAASATFLYPHALSIDSAGNLYVGEFVNSTIRKITPAGVVTTLAGLARSNGTADGTGAAARFSNPFGTAVDGAGNVFVADTYNNTIRKITPAGVVTTIAGLAGTQGSANGSGSAARFSSPTGIAIDSTGTLYVVEGNNHAVRVGTPSGGNKVAGITIPRLVPAGASVVEARALAEQPGNGVIVAVSASYAVRPTVGAQALVLPSYTNPQPYNLSYVVRLLANGQPDPAFTSAPGGDGTVNAVAVQSDGKIIVGGTFTTFNGVLFRNLARLQADGKSDPTFILGSGVDAQVNALAVQSDGKILVGGLFQNFAGKARPWLLRLNASGAVDETFTPALNGAVNSIVVQPDGKILIGGNFTSAGGASRTRLARLLSGGGVDTSFDPGAGANDEVVTLLAQTNGAVIAAGDFTSFAGQSRGRIVRVTATGALDATFLSSANANSTVLCLGVQADGKIVLGGAFTTVNGVTRNRLARLAADGSLDTTFDPAAGFNKDVRALIVRSDGTAFLAGLFDQFQGASVEEVVALSANLVATTFVQAPLPITVNAGGTARFTADASGVGISFQWLKDGVAIAGATSSSLTLTNVTTASQGRYTLRATSVNGAVLTADAALTVADGSPAQIINLSVLTGLEAGEGSFTLGFVIGGSGTSGAKALLIRAAGPQLAQFGVGNPMPDPKLQFFAGPTLSGENNDWGGTQPLKNLFGQVGAFPYLIDTSKDAAFAANVSNAANSVVVSGVNNSTGTVIAEVYDATPAGTVTATTPRLINVSVLKQIPAGATLTAGFVIGGVTSKTVLIRAVGPTLSGFGVGGPLGDPKLTLNQGSTPIATNDNWGGSTTLKAAFESVGAFALDGASKDAAILITLPPGSYTAQANAVGSLAGAALVEVYEVP